MPDRIPANRKTNDPANANSRLFVGNVDQGVTHDQLQNVFSAYDVVAVTVMRGFGFVQFATPKDAADALTNENGRELAGRYLTLKLPNATTRPSTEKKSGSGGGGQRSAAVTSSRSRGSRSHGRSVARVSRRTLQQHRSSRHTSVSAKRSRRDSDLPAASIAAAAAATWGVTEEPVLPLIPRSTLLEDERQFDCEILQLFPSSGRFAQDIVSRLECLGLASDVVICRPGSNVNQILDMVLSRGTLYAIVLFEGCEIRGHLSLHVLHGSPQDYRNIPVDDAMNIIMEDVEGYNQSKLGARSDAVPPEILELFDMLRDNRPLEDSDYEALITYLQDRRSMSHFKGASNCLDPMISQNPVAGEQVMLQRKIMNIMQNYKDSSNFVPIKPDVPIRAPLWNSHVNSKYATAPHRY